MPIKIYISGNSGNKEIVTHQQRIFMILKSLGIQFQLVDITSPGMEEEREFMRKNGKKKDGERNVLPPQIFHDDNYCGDYDDFDLANEDDELEEFLGIPRVTPKSVPIFKKDGDMIKEKCLPNGEISENLPPSSSENELSSDHSKQNGIDSNEENDRGNTNEDNDRVNANATADLESTIMDETTEAVEEIVDDVQSKETLEEEKGDDAEDKGGEGGGGQDQQGEDDEQGEEEEEYEYEEYEDEGADE